MTPVATDLSLRRLGLHLLSAHLFDPVQQRLVGSAALGAIDLVGSLQDGEVFGMDVAENVVGINLDVY